MPGLERRLKAERVGRGAVRPLHPRPLRHRCLALSDDAARRRGAAHDRGGRAGDRDCARGRRAACCRAAAAPRNAGRRSTHSLVIDCSKYLNRILELDVAGRRCVVEPGIVLDELNRALKPHGLWFPVDISTASRATIGGMAGNNSCGARSLRYGNTRENVLSIDAVLADGSARAFRPGRAGSVRRAGGFAAAPLARDLLALGAREADEIEARFPKVQRRVGGYNLDALLPGTQRHQSRAYPGRLRRHARLLDADRAEALAAARPPRGRRLPFRQLLRGDGCGAAHRQARADRGRAGRPHHDRARARHRDVPADARAVRARRARGDPAGRVRRGRPRGESAPPEAARRADGRSRLRLGQDRRASGAAWSRCSIRRCRPRSPRCAPPASTS